MFVLTLVIPTESFRSLVVGFFVVKHTTHKQFTYTHINSTHTCINNTHTHTHAHTAHIQSLKNYGLRGMCHWYVYKCIVHDHDIVDWEIFFSRNVSSVNFNFFSFKHVPKASAEYSTICCLTVCQNTLHG